MIKFLQTRARINIRESGLYGEQSMALGSTREIDCLVVAEAPHGFAIAALMAISDRRTAFTLCGGNTGVFEESMHDIVNRLMDIDAVLIGEDGGEIVSEVDND